MPSARAMSAARPRPRRALRGALFVLVGLAVVSPASSSLSAQPLEPPSVLARAVPYPGSRRAEEIKRGPEFGTDVFGWLALGRVLWSSGYDQVVGSPKVWPQDAESYGRRFLTRSAQLVAIEATRHGAAALLGRDPAYVSCACEGRWPRLGHATAAVLTDFDMDGRRRIAWPRFLGATAGAIVLGQLQPGQGAPQTMAIRAVTTIGAGLLGNVAKEFKFMPGSARDVAARSVLTSPRAPLRDGESHAVPLPGSPHP